MPAISFRHDRRSPARGGSASSASRVQREIKVEGGEIMRHSAARRRTHLQLDHVKLTRAKIVLGEKTETGAIERALALVVEEHRLDQLLKWVKGRMQLQRVFR